MIVQIKRRAIVVAEKVRRRKCEGHCVPTAICTKFTVRDMDCHHVDPAHKRFNLANPGNQTLQLMYCI